MSALDCLTEVDLCIYQIRDEIADMILNMKAGNTRLEMIEYINEEYGDYDGETIVNR